MVDNAGYGHVGAIEELSDDELRRQLDVNLFGVINVTRAALPHSRKQRSGHLVQMSSLNGVEGLPGAGNLDSIERIAAFVARKTSQPVPLAA